MADDNNLNSILEKLNSPEMSDTINSILSSLSASDSSDNGDCDSSNDVFSNLFSSLGNSNLDLLTALKPYLNEKRQKKIEQCENFISIIKTLEILNAFNKE